MAENDTIAVDFDGVIHKYSKGWHDGSIYDGPVDGAMESLIFMKSCGYRVVVFTAREDTIGVHNWIRNQLRSKAQSLVTEAEHGSNQKTSSKQ